MPLMKNDGSWNRCSLSQEKSLMLDEKQEVAFKIVIISTELLNSINTLLLYFESSIDLHQTLIYREFFDIESLKEHLNEFISVSKKESVAVNFTVDLNKHSFLPVKPFCINDIGIKKSVLNLDNIIQILDYSSKLVQLLTEIDESLMISLLYQTFLINHNKQDFISNFNQLLIFFIDCQNLCKLEKKLQNKLQGMNYKEKRKYFVEQEFYTIFHHIEIV
jgi:hypothetical protein